VLSGNRTGEEEKLKITFVEWLYNRTLWTVIEPSPTALEPSPKRTTMLLPRKDEHVSFKNQLYKVVLVTHSFDANLQYSAQIEVEAISPAR
jgi:hypothetical protein